jgi:dipeptidase E
LSSWRLGDRPDLLLSLTGGPGRAVVIANAMDAADERTRANAVSFELRALAGLGYDVAEADLRTCDPRTAFAGCELVWVRGGNVFVLREALARSGADVVLTELVRTDAVVYAGYSAGCCVLAPSLRGLEVVDDPAAATGPRWDGPGLLDHAIVPHYRSDHPESAAVERVVEGYRDRAVAHRVLRDGEVVLIGARSGVASPAPSRT